MQLDPGWRQPVTTTATRTDTQTMSSTLTFRPAGHAEWESEDWRWTIVSRPLAYPDNGERGYSVKDRTTDEWVEEDFGTYEEAVAYCEAVHRDELEGLR